MRKAKSRVLGMGMTVVLALGTLTCEAGASESQTVHSVTGSLVEASSVTLEDGAVHLQEADGKETKIGLSQLVPEDQKLITEPAGETAQLAPKMKELFGDELETAEGKKVSATVLGGAPKIGLYFSAHWCPPCRAFSPKLVAAYNDLKEQGKPFELVFVSSDRGAEAMAVYMRELKMPWYAVPFESERRRGLGKTYGVRGIPRLVIISDQGEILSQNAVGDIRQLGAKAYDKW